MRLSTRVWIRIIAPLSAGTLALAACSAGSEGDDSREGVLDVAVTALPRSGDSFKETSLAALAVYRAVYDRLFAVAGGELSPELAVSWKALDDTTWQIKLRKNVTFHDGSAFNAKAVKWNLAKIGDPDVKSPHAGAVESVRKIEIVDPHTLRLHTRKPNGALLTQLSRIMIQSPTAYKKLGPGGFARSPVGTGPFRVTEWNQATSVKVTKFDDYWRGKPRLESIVFREIPEASTRVASILAGKADIVYEVPPERASELRDSGMRVVNVPLAQTLTLYLRNNQGGPLEDVRVRRAIAYALDVNGLAKSLLGEFATLPVGGGLTVPRALGHAESLKAYPQNLAKARDLLTEAGYPDGFTVKFHTTDGRYAKDREAAVAVADQLSQVGIKADIQILESGLYLEKLFASALASLYTMGLNSAPTYDASQSYFPVCAGPIKASDTPELCEMYDRQLSALDQGERERILQDMARHRHQQAFAIQLFRLPGIYAISPEVERLELNSDYSFADYAQVRLSGQG